MPARKTLGHVPPEKFAEIRDKAGVKNTEIAQELGVSPTRLTELTKTKGGTSRQFKRVREAVAGLRARRRMDRLAAKRDEPSKSPRARVTRTRRLRPIHA